MALTYHAIDPKEVSTFKKGVEMERIGWSLRLRLDERLIIFVNMNASDVSFFLRCDKMLQKNRFDGVLT